MRSGKTLKMLTEVLQHTISSGISVVVVTHNKRFAGELCCRMQDVAWDYGADFERISKYKLRVNGVEVSFKAVVIDDDGGCLRGSNNVVFYDHHKARALSNENMKFWENSIEEI